MTLTIRLATEEDIPALVEARLVLFEALWKKQISEEVRTNGLAKLPEQFKTMMGDNLFCFIAEEDGRTVSVACFSIMRYLSSPVLPTGIFGRISNVYTRTEYRNKGYARALIEHIIQFARERHLDAVTLEASDMGKPLYEQLGFVEDNLDQHLPMTLNLS